MEFIQPFLNMALGAIIVICFILAGTAKSLVKKLKKYEEGGFTSDEYEKLKEDYTILLNEKQEVENERDKLRGYIGVVNEKEFGIINYDLVETDNETGKSKPLEGEFEFKVVKRGKDRVKIQLIDYKVENKNRSEKLFERCKSIIEGWYEIDDIRITWIEPDKAVIRDFKIDEALGN